MVATCLQDSGDDRTHASNPPVDKVVDRYQSQCIDNVIDIPLETQRQIPIGEYDSEDCTPSAVHSRGDAAPSSQVESSEGSADVTDPTN